MVELGLKLTLAYLLGSVLGSLVVYLAPSVAVAVVATWLIVVLLTGFVGLATIGAVLAAVVFVAFTGLPEDAGLFAYACCNAALLIYAHRGNIRRMLNGTESRVTTPVFGRRFDGK